MKHFILFILFLILVLPSQAQSFDDTTRQTLKNYIAEFPDQTQFSVAIVDGNENKTHFYGLVKFSDAITQLDNSTSVFQIGSVTKVFTSTLLAKLVLDQQVKLTDSIQKFFPFPLKEPGITLEQLANHTSGLPRLPSNLNLATVNRKNPYQFYSEADLEYYLTTEMSVSSTEGKPTYQYSNLGAGMLAKALENATNYSFSELLSEKIFQPLEMKQSTLDKDAVGTAMVQGLDPAGSPTPIWDMEQFEGAGAILSTTQDLSKFARAHFNNNNLFLLTTLPTFMVNENLRIGLGWHILQDEQGHNLYWHNGGTGGYSASFFMIPETQKAVIILTNVSAFHPKASNIDELGFRLLKAP